MHRMVSTLWLLLLLCGNTMAADDQALKEKRSKEYDEYFRVVAFDQEAWVKADAEGRAKMERDQLDRHKKLAKTNFIAAKELAARQGREKDFAQAIETLEAARKLAVSNEEIELLDGNIMACELCGLLQLVRDTSEK